MSEKVFKVLCIDGGGIKGLYSAKILEHFEEKFACCISDYFDMLCGTSTGGLIALALSLKIPTAEICRFYEEEGPKIFPEYPKWLSFLRQTVLSGKYSDEPLRAALRKMFGDRKIAQSHNLLCIPSYSLTEARPWIFKFDHKEGDLSRDNKALYVDVALATSAAPTYFPLVEIPYYDYKQFVDGGVWGNNPSLVGFIEALKFFVGKDKPFDKLSILSISSLSVTGGKQVGLTRHRSFRHWRDELFEASLTGQSLFTEYFLNEIASTNGVPLSYYRIPSPKISKEQENLIQLDVATPNALNLIRGKGNDVGDVYRKKPEIANFFTEKKIYQTQTNL